MKKYSETELAWAAGFYDGEGCTFLRHKRYPAISIGQNDPEVLIKFHNAVKLGSVHYAGESKTGYEIYTYRVNGYEQVQQVLCLMWKYLSGMKRAQAERVLQVAQYSFQVKPARKGGKKTPWSENRIH